MTNPQAFTDIVEMIAANNPQGIVSYTPSAETLERVQYLLFKKSEERLSNDEEAELNHFTYLENMIGLAKARALNLMAMTA